MSLVPIDETWSAPVASDWTALEENRITTASHSMRRMTVIGGLAALMLVGGLGGWAVSTDIEGAVIADGVVAVETSSKKIQHPTGGVIKTVAVRDGDVVKAGTVIASLDESIARSNLQIILKSIDELIVRQARLLAERDGQAEMQLPPELLARMAKEKEVADLVASEKRLFAIRQEALKSSREQLFSRISRIEETIRGMDAQLAAKTREVELIKTELAGVYELQKKKLTTTQRVVALERDETRIKGELGQIAAAKAEAGGRIAESRLAIIELEQKSRSEVGSDLRDSEAKLKEMRERYTAARTTLDQIDIRAPQDGLIQQLTVHAPGAVIGPGEVFAMVVPDREKLVVDAQVSTYEIDKLVPDQAVYLRFPAFNSRTTPELEGKISFIAGDRAVDPKDPRVAWYPVRVQIEPDSLAKLGDKRLVPGMPVDVRFRTSARTVASYLVKPLADQLSRAFKAE